MPLIRRFIFLLSIRCWNIS